MVFVNVLSSSVTSPGTLVHDVTASDQDGLDSIRIRVLSADSVLARDSIEIPLELYFFNDVYSWTVPAGIPVGTVIRISAEAWDFAEFVGADTALITVQSGAAVARPGPGRKGRQWNP